MRAPAPLFVLLCLSLLSTPATAAAHPLTGLWLVASAEFGQLSLPSASGGNNEVPTDPFASRQATLRNATVDRQQPAAGGNRPVPARPGIQAAPGSLQAPATRQPLAPQQQSQTLLLAARRALAAGNQQQALAMIDRAKKLGITYPLHADSPIKVEALARRASQLVASATNSADPVLFNRNRARLWMDQARGLMRYGAYPDARQLVDQAKSLPVQYQAFETTPQKMLVEINALQQAATRQKKADQAAANGLSRAPGQLPRQLPQTPANAAAQLLPNTSSVARFSDQNGARFSDRNRARFSDQGIRQAGAIGPNQAFPAVRQGLYDPSRDPNRVVAVQATTPAPDAAQTVATTTTNSVGVRLFQQGMQALVNQDRPTALRFFSEAWQFEAELDPAIRQELKTKLALLQTAPARTTPAQAAPSPLDQFTVEERLKRDQLQREILNEQKAAEELAAQDPNAGLARLQRLRDRVNETTIDAVTKKQMLTLVDSHINRLQTYIDRNRAQIAQDQHNREVRQGVTDRRLKKNDMENKIAELVEEFNTLVDERRFAEAEAVARQAQEIDARNPVVVNLMAQSRFIRRIAADLDISMQKEQGVFDALQSVDASSIPVDDRQPLVFNPTKWRELSRDRRRLLERYQLRFNEAELQIQKQLKVKVDVKFQESPLQDVLETLGAMANVNVYLDPYGLSAEGVTTDTPVTINLRQPIALSAALRLILEPLNLSYVIQNEVLRVTSMDAHNQNVYSQVYNVADLVIPIPNFVPTYNMGLAGAIRESYRALGYGENMPASGSAPLMMAANETGSVPKSSAMAQLGATGALRSLGSRPQVAGEFGSNALGGAAAADFDSLIELITSTIAPDSWDEVGGNGAIKEFGTNLSLVISQTQEIHDQIADLLDQLRRLQDLQVTIEMRFITLSDNFFERIGIDFDFDIDDNTNMTPTDVSHPSLDDSGPSMVIGLAPDGQPTSDLDFSFTQDFFQSAIPQFGGFDVGTAANFGFAILSDIEAFFVIQAAHGDNRTNVLEAPKVTLFNGQQASVMDVQQRPFVTGLIPIVGDFAAAHQPVVTVLNEGTSLSVQAVVSSDRRFVRLTLVPLFSNIGNVEEFTFEGKETSDTSSIADEILDDQGNTDRAEAANNIRTREGSTVQLPVFGFTMVSTTVAVPDGGTVLMGGIKRLREGRAERGMPILHNIPYINRLFKNVGIGRDTQSLMMMVTPRIIIQEEEELLQTGYDSSED